MSKGQILTDSNVISKRPTAPAPLSGWRKVTCIVLAVALAGGGTLFVCKNIKPMFAIYLSSIDMFFIRKTAVPLMFGTLFGTIFLYVCLLSIIFSKLINNSNRSRFVARRAIIGSLIACLFSFTVLAYVNWNIVIGYRENPNYIECRRGGYWSRYFIFSRSERILEICSADALERIQKATGNYALATLGNGEPIP